MQTTQQAEEKKTYFTGRVIRLVGILMLLGTFFLCAAAITLDVIGEKTVGELSNASSDCSPDKSCWTGKVTFTASNNQTVDIYPQTNRFLLDFENAISGKPYEEYDQLEVRYLAQYPKIAKIRLTLFLEYLNKVTWFVIGLIVFLVGNMFSGRRQPLVLDLRKFRKNLPNVN